MNDLSAHSACRASRVLLVEDDELFAAVAMEIIRPFAGGEWVASAEEALAALPREDWDLVIADVGLPGMSGLELAREVKHTCPLAAILILTAHATLDTAVSAIRTDADDFLTKPVAPSALAAKVSELIAMAGARKAAPTPPVPSSWATGLAGADQSGGERSA
jgi:DNA-binding response OmpR family regulator